jgi:integrase
VGSSLLRSPRTRQIPGAVKERLGHASIMTTQRYLHTLPDADETAVVAFSRVRHRTSATPRRGKGRSA